MAELNREKWLTTMAHELERHIFRALDRSLRMPKFRVSCSWPGGGSPSTRIGECWGHLNSADGTYEMFISPELSDSLRVTDVLAHEMIHAIVGLECGHKGRFPKVAKLIGLEGKPTETVAGPQFIEAVEPILAKMPPYPHATLRPSPKKKKGSQRLLKLTCADEECEAHRNFLVYSNRTQVETWGTPLCPACQGPTGIFE